MKYSEIANLLTGEVVLVSGFLVVHKGKAQDETAQRFFDNDVRYLFTRAEDPKVIFVVLESTRNKVYKTFASIKKLTYKMDDKDDKVKELKGLLLRLQNELEKEFGDGK